MKYNMLGGGSFEAASPDEIVEALRQDGQEWIPTVSSEDFMEGMAERCKTQTGVVIRTDSAANFVADLQYYGFIIPAGQP